MAIKIASVLVAKGSFERGKEILDSQYLMTGADQRFGCLDAYSKSSSPCEIAKLRKNFHLMAIASFAARNASVDDHQILSALERILNESSTEAAASQYESAKLFFLSLLDMRFTSLKDVFLKCFMQFLVERDEIAKAIMDLNEFLSYGKSKSTSGAMFIVLRAAYCSKDQHLIEQVKTSMENWIKSNLQRVCLNGCVMLAEEKPIEFAEYLRVIRFVC
ncbi:unnamed protein product [Anisakis simplex]|uniref:Uncharacterized protein n=1 Tax=Anisakis simplex TaxID=6269 RepID=A0A0M3J460_ANISI|nr:unnamed protein product [Anisakis simplex]